MLSWNGRDDTLACLGSLEHLDSPRPSVVCVDNGSSDGTAVAIRERFPDVHLVETGRNLGFAGGNNAGIRHALGRGADWIVLLNNDALIAADCLTAFEAAAHAHPSAGILGGKVLFQDPPDRIWFAGQRFNPRLGYSGRPRGYGRRDGPRYAKTVGTDRAVGALMAAPRRTIDAVGLLDEDLFLYVEDVDWCLRARAAGFEVLIVPDARAWHSVSASGGGEALSTNAVYYGARNTLVVSERHAPLGRVRTALRRAVVAATFSLYALTRARRREALGAVRQGLRDAAAGRLGPRGR